MKWLSGIVAGWLAVDCGLSRIVEGLSLSVQISCRLSVCSTAQLKRKNKANLS